MTSESETRFSDAVMLEIHCESCGFLMHRQLDDGELVCLPTEERAGE